MYEVYYIVFDQDQITTCKHYLVRNEISIDLYSI